MSDTPKFPDGTAIEVGIEVEFELRDGKYGDGGSPRWNFDNDCGSSGKWGQGKIARVMGTEFSVDSPKISWAWPIPVAEQSLRPGFVKPLHERKKVKCARLVDAGGHYKLIEIDD